MIDLATLLWKSDNISWRSKQLDSVFFKTALRQLLDSVFFKTALRQLLYSVIFKTALGQLFDSVFFKTALRQLLCTYMWRPRVKAWMSPFMASRIQSEWLPSVWSIEMMAFALVAFQFRAWILIQILCLVPSDPCAMTSSMWSRDLVGSCKLNSTRPG